MKAGQNGKKSGKFQSDLKWIKWSKGKKSEILQKEDNKCIIKHFPAKYHHPIFWLIFFVFR